MNAQTYIIEKYNITQEHLPIEIPNIGRNDLAKLFCELKFINGAEIGVEVGKYSEVLAKANPNCRLYLVDSWQYWEERAHVSQETLEGFYKTTLEKMAIYPMVKVIRGYSLDVVKFFQNESLDFVYIDADHRFEPCYQDICAWYEKIVHGGIICGHDFIKHRNSHFGVKEAVTKFMTEKEIDLWFVLGRRERVAGEVRDISRSWMAVKP